MGDSLSYLDNLLLSMHSAVGTDTVFTERFCVRGHIFSDTFLSLNRQSSSFNDSLRVEKVK